MLYKINLFKNMLSKMFQDLLLIYNYSKRVILNYESSPNHTWLYRIFLCLPHSQSSQWGCENLEGQLLKGIRDRLASAQDSSQNSQTSGWAWAGDWWGCSKDLGSLEVFQLFPRLSRLLWLSREAVVCEVKCWKCLWNNFVILNI